MQKILFSSGLVLVTCLATATATALAPLPRAHADDYVVNLPVQNITNPVNISATINQGDIAGFEVNLPAAQGGMPVATQCVQIPDVPMQSCIGSPTDEEQPPLDVSGGASLYPLVKWNEKARAALDWMIPEGIDFISGTYDVPKDDRILKFARPQLRTYIAGRLNNIMLKKATGLSLTENEQNALSFVEGERIKQNRLVAKYAWEEMQLYDAQGCGYKVPDAPKVVTDPEEMPANILTYCRVLKTTGPATMTDMPPRPSASKLTTWGAYRHADELGLSLFSSPIAVKNLVDMQVVGAAYSGIAATTFAVSTGVMMANAAAIGKVILPYAARWIWKPAAESIQAATSAGAGLLATAFIAAVVIVFLVVTGVAVYQLIQHDSVADTLYARVKDTQKETDPFDLVDPDLTKTPTYRDPDAYKALSVDVAKWTTVANECPPGQPQTFCEKGKPIADPKGLWPGNATGPDDATWLVTTGNGKAPVEKNVLTVPLRGDRTATVRFSDGWMIVKEGDKEPEAVLQFSYRDRSDTPSLVTGAPGSPTSLVVGNVDPRGEPAASKTKNIFFRDDKGNIVQARLKSPAPTYLGGPRPTAVGPLTTGRPTMLRPNPVGTNGASLDEAMVQDDYTFDWTVEHLDPVSGEWNPVHNAATYGTSWVPQEPGRYDARVTMTSIDDPTQQRFGKVEFIITPPPIAAPISVLQDNGLYNLELDLQFTEEVPQDILRVDVTWPGPIGGNDIKQALYLTCTQTGPIDCTTPRTGPANSLQFTADVNTDLHRPVVVEVQNSTGGTYRQEFLLGAGRPTVGQPAPADNASKPGTVVVTDDNTQVTFVLEESQGGQEYKVADLVPSVPGAGFGVVDPATGNTTGAIAIPDVVGNGSVYVSQDAGSGEWGLYVFGQPKLIDIGSNEVPIRVRDTNGAQQLVNVAVTTDLTTEDRIRGGIRSNIDPADQGTPILPKQYPMAMGGRASDAPYNGRMCVSLRYNQFGAPAVVRCGPMKDFRTASGAPKLLPYAKYFPTGMDTGSYTARVWLTTPGKRVDTNPLIDSFSLTEPATYPRPKVGLDKVTVKGTAKVGTTLKVAKLSTDPGGAKATYQWLRDGKKIAGAKSASYKLKGKDRGDRISVRVVVTYPQWKATTRTSAKTTRVR